MSELKAKLLFLIFYPMCISALGFLTSFNITFIVLGCASCILGILISPMLLKYFHSGTVKDAPVKHAKLIHNVIFAGAILLFLHHAVFEQQVEVNHFWLHMIQYLLSGTVTQAIYAFYIQK